MKEKIPHIKIEPPGPEAKKWLKRTNDTMAPYNRPFYYPLVVAGGEGAVIKDVDGNKFIDLNSGLGVLNIGQCNPQIIETIHQKSKEFVHYSYTDFACTEPVILAERLNTILPMKCKFFMASGGTEANEAALKIARHFTKRPLFLGFIGSFHGRTFGTMPFSSTSPVQRQYFHPFMPGVTLLPYPYCYRCPFKLNYPSCNMWCVDYIEEWVLNKFVPPEEVAAILVEPIAGEGGYIVPPPEFFPKLKKIADKYKILIIADEVQTGCGRTGKFLAIEHFNITPDIVTLGKAIGGGVPLSVAAVRSDVMDLPAGAHCTTTGGNPISCAAAMTFLDILYNEKLIQRAAELGKYVMMKFREMQKEYGIIGDVRGKGLAICIEFVEDRVTKEPIDSKDIVNRLFKKGLLAVPGGYGVRIFPPLVIENELIDTSVDIFEEVIAEINKEYD
jgi:4-aminobutyrate aminotransferase